jgi:protein-L-isoaspartate(D-aspartate) O-methyltransferase
MKNMSTDDAFQQDRERMVREQLAARNITNHAVLDAMRAVPRHLFVPEDLGRQAYADGPLRLDHGQTISQPYIVALMTQLLDLEGHETILEIGTGSGYQAAILANLAKQVYSIERIAELAIQAREVLSELGLANVEVIEGDGSLGYPAKAPYEGIIVTAAPPKVPQPLKDQLVEGGVLILPVGAHAGQTLERWTRKGDDFKRESMAPVAFVPLVGEHGWSSEERPLWGW